MYKREKKIIQRELNLVKIKSIVLQNKLFVLKNQKWITENLLIINVYDHEEEIGPALNLQKLTY